jgi:hypothetical protein
MQRQTRYMRPGFGQFPAAADLRYGAEANQQVPRGLERRRRRRLEPFQPGRIGDAHRCQRQHHRRQLRARDLRFLVRRAALEIRGRIEPHDSSGRGPSRSPGALVRRRFADARDVEPRQARPGRLARDSRQPAVDYRPHPLDGHGTLGHVGRKNYLPVVGRRHGAILLFGGQIPV